MGIKISKLETSKGVIDGDKLLTPLYGFIKIIDSPSADHILFDEFDGYDLFIDSNADEPVAVKKEDIGSSNESNSISDTINEISSKYDVEKVDWIDSELSIIVKASKDVISQICKDYENNSVFKVNPTVDTVLFLELKDKSLKLTEDGDVLDALDDNDLKSIASKTGVKLSGSENKDELKGIVKGSLNKK